MSKRCINRLHPAAIDNNCSTDERIKKWFDIGTTSSNVSAQWCTNGRSGAGRATRTQSKHGAAERFRAERFKGTATSIDPINNNRSQCFADGSFESCFPARIDFNQIENRAEDSVDTGKTFGTRSRTSFVEGQSKRFDSSSPRMLLAFGCTVHRFRRFNRGLCLRTTRFGQFHGFDQREFSRFQFDELRPK